MPGFDGTGPRGSGPMTGGARGYCLLKVPETPEEPMVGLAGMEGKPVRIVSFSQRGQALAQLKLQAASIENTLKTILHRIDALKSVRETGRSETE